MLRMILSVVFGFVSMAVVVMVGTFALVAALVPGGLSAMRSPTKAPTPQLPVLYYAANIALSFAAAIFSAWVTAQTGAPAPRNQLVALAALILTMGVVSARSRDAERQPTWYKWLIPIVGATGVAVGAFAVHAV
ncbi:MAG TPA: hypothetical protein VGN65_08990 [Casimicrobiaceae bacterium]